MNKKVLDVIIAGVNCDYATTIFEQLFQNYDSLNIYCIGAPSDGINRMAQLYAFKHCYPLTVGCIEDIQAIKDRFEAADNKAVLVFVDEEFNDDNATDNYIEANIIALETKNCQYKIYNVTTNTFITKK